MNTSDERPDLHEVLEHYGWEPPAERPGWVSVKCQVHGESRPSCRVNFDKQILVCMACDFKGDVYTVIEHHESVGFREAVEIGRSFTASEHSPSPTTRRHGRTTSRGYVPPRLRRK